MEINKIYGEDCQETMGKMPNDFIDLTITSPPYFNARDYSQYDNVKAYMAEMACIFREVFRVSKPSRMVIVNISPVLVGRSK
ncbi:DNA methyltransferase, partial [Lacticaseibacillus paracasei]